MMSHGAFRAGCPVCHCEDVALKPTAAAVQVGPARLGCRQWACVGVVACRMEAKASSACMAGTSSVDFADRQRPLT
jgi:hypothetical protein